MCAKRQERHQQLARHRDVRAAVRADADSTGGLARCESEGRFREVAPLVSREENPKKQGRHRISRSARDLAQDTPSNLTVVLTARRTYNNDTTVPRVTEQAYTGIVARSLTPCSPYSSCRTHASSSRHTRLATPGTMANGRRSRISRLSLRSCHLPTCVPITHQLMAGLACDVGCAC